MDMGELRHRLSEYEQARQWDSECGEADNCGNVAGDRLAACLRESL